MIKQSNEINIYSAKLGLEANLVDIPLSTDEADLLLKLQQRVLTMQGVTDIYKSHGFNKAQREEEQAFKKLNELIKYCNTFLEPEAYQAMKQLQEIQLPLATTRVATYKNYIKDLRTELTNELLENGFSSNRAKSAISALITLHTTK